MIPKRWILVILSLFLLALLTTPAQANPTADTYEISSFTYDAGGSTVASADGVYSLTTTFGQPDAASLAGSEYSLEGGFWHSGIQGGSIFIPMIER